MLLIMVVDQATADYFVLSLPLPFVALLLNCRHAPCSSN